jgi:hypothetical protein
MIDCPAIKQSDTCLKLKSRRRSDELLGATPISDAITCANLGSAMSCKQSLATAQAKKHTTDMSRSNLFQNVRALGIRRRPPGLALGLSRPLQVRWMADIGFRVARKTSVMNHGASEHEHREEGRRQVAIPALTQDASLSFASLNRQRAILTRLGMPGGVV